MCASVSSSPSLATICIPGAAGGAVGLGHGVAVAAGVLVLVSTVMLASYLCVLTKAVAAHAATVLADAPAVDVQLGLDGAAIDALCPKFLHAGSGDGGGGGGGEEEGTVGGPCAICLGEFAPGDALRRGSARCVHMFHAGCAERWLRVRATCPVCRSSPVPSTSPIAAPPAEAVSGPHRARAAATHNFHFLTVHCSAETSRRHPGSFRLDLCSN
ncbi:hypothetical protein ACP70R_021873 [Stipagrostis hirtigluma subsp. patula]